MNFLGAIGSFMEGTGLKNILETVYGEHAIVHIMTDKCLHSQLISDRPRKIPRFKYFWIRPRSCTLPFLGARRR
ncbi:hypothetical protein DPMN_106990 [Dreissena polymorpha]|uniref:Uncharacterized protein n=1 Tax=Dreissena polymorpha TaxID=45954 RepID=A0A9D4K5X5_DREPO|nr:hypothetical protein DPMN_106990 [Dreissena polymorpha]